MCRDGYRRLCVKRSCGGFTFCRDTPYCYDHDEDYDIEDSWCDGGPNETFLITEAPLNALKMPK